MVVSRIAPAESDLAIAEGDQAVVGDGHAMSVAAEIVHHVLGATEGTFQVQPPNPVDGGAGSQAAKVLGCARSFRSPWKWSWPFLKRLFESVDELAAKTFCSTFLGRK